MLWLPLLVACSSTDGKSTDTSPVVTDDTSPDETSKDTADGESGDSADETADTEETQDSDTNGESEAALEVLSLSATVPDGRPTEVQLQAELSREVEGRWSCVGLDEEGVENRHVSAPHTGAVQDAALYGLLPEVTYTCALEVEGVAVGQVSVDTGAFADVPALLVTGTIPTGSGAWTVLNIGSECDLSVQQRVWVLDPAGRPRWAYDLDPHATTDIDAAWVGDSFVIGGGSGMAGRGAGIVRRVTLDHGLLVDRDKPETGIEYHHHAELLDTKQIVALTWNTNTGPVGTFTGFGFELINATTGAVELVWDSQSAIDAGTLFSDAMSDAFHANAIHWLPDDPFGPAWWVSLAAIDGIARIDAATLEVTDVLNAAGGYTLYDAYGEPAPDDEWFVGQHAMKVSVVGSELRFTMHDNGFSPYYGSRLLDLLVDPVARTAVIDYAWEEAGWYEGTGGDYDVLDNGNRLAVRGHCPCCDDRDIDRLSDVIEVDAKTGSVVWSLQLPDDGMFSYRAQRVDGCELFRDTTWCPTLDE